MSPVSFEELLAQARAGDREAFGTVLENCRRFLRRLGYMEIPCELRPKGSPSDLVQDTFLEAQLALPQFQGKTERQFLTWLCTILVRNANNLSRRYRRRLKRQCDREISLDDERFATAIEDLPEPRPTPVDNASKTEETRLLEAAIAELPQTYVAVVRLRNDRLSFEEIGTVLHCTGGAARKLWARAVAPSGVQVEVVSVQTFRLFFPRVRATGLQLFLVRAGKPDRSHRIFLIFARPLCPEKSAQ